MGYHLVISQASRKAEEIIAVSNHTKGDIKKHLSINEEKIHTIYNGIDSSFVSLAEKENQKKINLPALWDNKDRKYEGKIGDFMIYTGVHREHKNLSKLFDALKILKEKYRSDMPLVITGKKEDKYHSLYDKIEKLNIEDRVFFAKFLPEDIMKNVLQKARLFVFPSLYEGFGFPPLEAMACKVPVCASNRTSIPEVCGDAASYFDPENEGEMAQKIHELLSQEKLRQKLVEKGLKRVKIFSWQECAEKTLGIYEKAAMRNF